MIGTRRTDARSHRLVFVAGAVPNVAKHFVQLRVGGEARARRVIGKAQRQGFLMGR